MEIMHSKLVQLFIKIVSYNLNMNIIKLCTEITEYFVPFILWVIMVFQKTVVLLLFSLALKISWLTAIFSPPNIMLNCEI